MYKYLNFTKQLKNRLIDETNLDCRFLFEQERKQGSVWEIMKLFSHAQFQQIYCHNVADTRSEVNSCTMYDNVIVQYDNIKVQCLKNKDLAFIDNANKIHSIYYCKLSQVHLVGAIFYPTG